MEAYVLSAPAACFNFSICLILSEFESAVEENNRRLSGKYYSLQRADSLAGFELVQSSDMELSQACYTLPVVVSIFVILKGAGEWGEQDGQKKYLISSVDCSSGKLLFPRCNDQATCA